MKNYQMVRHLIHCLLDRSTDYTIKYVGINEVKQVKSQWETITVNKKRRFSRMLQLTFICWWAGGWD